MTALLTQSKLNFIFIPNMLEKSMTDELKFPRKYLYLLTAIGLTIIVFAFIYYGDRKTAKRDQYAESLKAVSKLKIEQMVGWNEDRRLYTETISKDKSVINFLQKLTLAGSTENYREDLQELLSHYLGSDELINITFADNNKKFLISLYKEHINFYEGISETLEEVELTKRTVITDIHKPEGYDVHYGVVSPVYSNKKFIGMVITEFSLKRILNNVIPQWPYSSSTGEIVIAAKKDDKVQLLSKLKTENSTELENLFPISDSLPAAYAVKGYKGLVEGIDYKKDEVLAYVDSIPGTNYYLIAKINSDEVYSSLRPLRAWLVLSIVVLFAAAALIFLALWKSGSEKFYKKQLLVENEKNILKKHNEYLSKHANDMIFLISSEGEIIDVNEKACLVYEYTRDEFLKMKTEDLRVETEKPMFQIHLQKINTQSGYLFETIHKTKSGKVFSVEISSRFFEINNKKLIQSIVRDITERKTAEEAIRRSELRFRTLAETSNDLIFIYRTKPQMHVEFVSPSVSKVLGYSTEDFQNDPLFELQIIHPDDAAHIFGDYNHKKESKNHLLRYIHKNGSTVWLEQTRVIHFDQTNNIQLIFCTSRDVTERITIQKSLEESEKRYKSLARFIPVGIYRADMECNCLYANEKWCEIAGVSAKDAVGKGWMKSVHPDDIDLLMNKWVELLKGKDAGITEFRLIKPNKEISHVLGSIVPEYDNDGIIKGFVGSVTDISENKRMEKAIQYQNLMYETLLKTTIEGIHILDENGNVIHANESFCKLLGYTEEEALTLNVSDWNELYEGEFFRRERDAIIERPNIFEATMKRKNGVVIDAEISATGIVFNDTFMIFCSARDITERKRVQKQIADSETKFRSLYELANDSILLIDPDNFRITDCNPAAEQLFGTDKNNIIGKMPADLSPALQPDGSISEIVSEHYMKKCKENNFARFEWTHHKYFEQPVLVEISLKKITMNSQVIIQAIIRDLTEIKKQEDQIKLLYRSVEQSPASIVLTNTRGEIEYANPSCLKLTGFTKEELIGNNPRLLQSGLTPSDTYEQLWSTILNGEEWRGEFLNRKKNGELYWETAVVSPVKNEAGEIIHFVAVKENITERKRIEEELVQAKEKAEEMNRIKNAFLANISHELRTPLVGILGGASIINEEAENPEIKEFSRLIFESGNRLNDTLNSIIDISKLESSIHHAKIDKVNLIPLIKEKLEQFKPAAENKNLKLIFTNGIDKAFVHADDEMLKKSIHYLVHNAIKYTEKGEIKLSIEKVDHSFLLKVSDTGIGIPESFKESIYEPFRQASEGLARRFEGNGLGLAITKKFVDLMNGDLWFESSEGIGTTFYLKLKRVDVN